MRYGRKPYEKTNSAAKLVALPSHKTEDRRVNKAFLCGESGRRNVGGLNAKRRN